MSFEADLLTGVAETIGAESGYTWRATGAYTAGDGFGIYVDLSPANDLPSITLTEYPVTDDITGGDSVVGIQARIAAKDRRAVKDAVSLLYDLFHARWGGSLGTIELIQAMRSSGANLGQDANGRLVRTENYYLTTYRR